MRTTVIALVLVAILLLGGCAGSGSKADDAKPRRIGSDPSKPVYHTAVEAAVKANTVRSGSADLGDWWLVPMQASPAGTLVAFEWTVPEGALAGGRVVLLEVAPVIVNETAPETWCLMAFANEAGVLRPAQPVSELSPGFKGSTHPTALPCETTTTVANRSVPGPGPQRTLPVVGRPFFLRVDLTLAQTDVVFFVLGAKSPNATDFGVALRAVADSPGPFSRASPSLEAFVDARGSTRPKSARVVGAGAGLHHAAYVSVNTVTLDAAQYLLVASDARAGPVQVVDRVALDPRPAATVRDVTIESRLDAPAGWSFTWGRYGGICAHGKWDAVGRLHGQMLQARSLIVQPAVCSYGLGHIVAAILLGSPGFAFTAGGPGEGRSTFTLQVTNTALDALQFGHVALGTSLDELFGKPAKAERWASTGLVGSVPPGA